MDTVKAMELFFQRMKSKNWSNSTMKNYGSGVRCFLEAFKDRPRAKEISAQEIEQYLLQKTMVNTRKHIRCGIQAFYSLVINQPMKLQHIPWPKKERKLPQPLEAADIQKIIAACTNLKHKSIICLLYGAGLRISEAINLKIADIDSQAMIIRVIAGKGKKDRLVMLAPSLLQLLRQYYLAFKPVTYIFNGQNNAPQYSKRSINLILKHYACKAGIKDRVHAHLLRHSFATHSLEQGTDIRFIQKVLGHNSIKTTMIYAHVSKRAIAGLTSPISALSL